MLIAICSLLMVIPAACNLSSQWHFIPILIDMIILFPWFIHWTLDFVSIKHSYCALAFQIIQHLFWCDSCISNHGLLSVLRYFSSIAYRIFSLKPCITPLNTFEFIDLLLVLHNAPLLQHGAHSSHYIWIKCLRSNWHSVSESLVTDFVTIPLHRNNHACVSQFNPSLKSPVLNLTTIFTNSISNCWMSSMVGPLMILVTSSAAIIHFVSAITIPCNIIIVLFFWFGSTTI